MELLTLFMFGASDIWHVSQVICPYLLGAVAPEFVIAPVPQFPFPDPPFHLLVPANLLLLWRRVLSQVVAIFIVCGLFPLTAESLYVVLI